MRPHKIQGKRRLPKFVFVIGRRPPIQRQALGRVQQQPLWFHGQIPTETFGPLETFQPFLPNQRTCGIRDTNRKGSCGPEPLQFGLQCPAARRRSNSLPYQSIIQRNCFAQTFFEPPIHSLGSHRDLFLLLFQARTFGFEDAFHIIGRWVFEFPGPVIGLHSLIKFLWSQIGFQVKQFHGRFLVSQGPVGFAIVIHGMRMPEGAVFAATQRQQQGKAVQIRPGFQKPFQGFGGFFELSA